MTEQTYSQKLGAAIMPYHRGQWSLEYSVASRLLAGHHVDRDDLAACAALLQSSGVRGSKVVARCLDRMARRDQIQWRKDIISVHAQLRRQCRQDDHLWPVMGRFNTFDRALRRVRAAVRAGLTFDDIESYRATLYAEISDIVNSAI